MALQNLDEDEKSYIKRIDLGLKPGKDMVIINEPGLYSLILRSRKPAAKAFKRWITHEVIPAIRKTGGYFMGEETMNEDEIVAQGLLIAAGFTLCKIFGWNNVQI